MTGIPHHTVLDYPDRPPITDPETLAWIETIEQIRLEEAPSTCEACGSTADPPRLKWCWRCQRSRFVSAFARDRSRRDGLRDVCRDCSATYLKRYRARIARNGGRSERGRVVRVSGRIQEAS